MRLRVLHTPGHTHHHVSSALENTDGDVHGVFTGGSMLYGATGRTDLVSPQDTTELTHAQYHSVRRLAREPPAEAAVFRTHGFGSFCSATPTSGDASTVGEQARVNPALTLAEQDYVDTLLAGLDAYPAYYAHMGPINRSGPAPVDPAELRWRWTYATAPRSPPGTCPAHWGSSCRRASSLTSAGSPATAPPHTDRRDPGAGRRRPPRAGPHRHRRPRQRGRRGHRDPRRRPATLLPRHRLRRAGRGHGHRTPGGGPRTGAGPELNDRRETRS